MLVWFWVSESSAHNSRRIWLFDRSLPPMKTKDVYRAISDRDARAEQSYLPYLKSLRRLFIFFCKYKALYLSSSLADIICNDTCLNQLCYITHMIQSSIIFLFIAIQTLNASCLLMYSIIVYETGGI